MSNIMCTHDAAISKAEFIDWVGCTGYFLYSLAGFVQFWREGLPFL